MANTISKSHVETKIKALKWFLKDSNGMKHLKTVKQAEDDLVFWTHVLKQINKK